MIIIENYLSTLSLPRYTVLASSGDIRHNNLLINNAASLVHAQIAKTLFTYSAVLLGEAEHKTGCKGLL